MKSGLKYKAVIIQLFMSGEEGAMKIAIIVLEALSVLRFVPATHGTPLSKSNDAAF